MKKMLLAAIIVAPLFSVAQDSTLTLSNFEKFSSKTGVLYKIEWLPLGKSGDLKISVAKTTNMETGKSVKAAQIIQNYGSFFGKVPIGSTTIDVDELDGVIRALELFKKAIAEGKPKTITTFNYTTKNDIALTCSYIESAFGGWAVEMAKEYHYIAANVPGTSVRIKSKDIADLVQYLKEVQASAF